MSTTISALPLLSRAGSGARILPVAILLIQLGGTACGAAGKLSVAQSVSDPAVGPAEKALLNRDFRDLGKEVDPGRIPLTIPKSEELLTVSDRLPTIRLEAQYNQPIGLRNALLYSLENNLPINISRQQLTGAKWVFVGAAGGFLPDLLMSYRQQIQQGSSLVGGVIPTTFRNPLVTASAGFRMYGARGGQVFYNTLTQLANYRAAKHELRATISDQLLAVAQQYYELVRQQALLEIQVRAVATSRAQVELNEKLERAGTGTRFAVLQSETQLASDEQNLLNQEVAFRASAIRLAATLNMNLGVNLLTIEPEVRKKRLVDPTLNINDLMNLAIRYRPELKQFEQLRLAARRQIGVAAAPLYPSFQFYGNINGSGATLSNDTTIVPSQLKIVPVNSAPPSGSIINTTGSQLTAPLTSVATAATPAAAVSRQIRPSYVLGIGLDWTLLGMDVPTLANVQAARANARAALLQSNQEFILVAQQVRTAYLNALIADRQIDVATKAVTSSSEQLRLSRVRLANGVGTNLDVIAAQQAYISALITKADAILKFNIAEAQLVHDVGLTSVDTLTVGSGQLLR